VSSKTAQRFQYANDVSSIAERFNWVRNNRVTDSGQPWSWQRWSDAISELGGETVSKNTLSAIGRGEIQNPSARVVEAAARAAKVSHLWLHYGAGPPDELQVPTDNDLADRQAIMDVMHLRGVSQSVIRRLREVNSLRGDLATWMFIAAQFIQEEKAARHDAGSSGDD